MKLKTKCSAHTIHGSMEDFEHDAAMAHALWQAMKDMLDPHERSVVSERATTIMAGWGHTP